MTYSVPANSMQYSTLFKFLNHSNSHSDFSFILFCNFFTCWVLFYVAWTHPKAPAIPWQPTCACCECFKKLAFSSYKSAQMSRDCSASQQHRTQLFMLSSHCILLWACYIYGIKVHFTSPFTIYRQKSNLKMSMYSLFFANCMLSSNSVSYKT